MISFDQQNNTMISIEQQHTTAAAVPLTTTNWGGAGLS